MSRDYRARSASLSSETTAIEMIDVNGPAFKANEYPNFTRNEMRGAI